MSTSDSSKHRPCPWCPPPPPQAEVERRGALTDKYQRLLLGSQEQLRAATQAHEAEVSALTERLRSKTDSAFSKVRLEWPHVRCLTLCCGVVTCGFGAVQ